MAFAQTQHIFYQHLLPSRQLLASVRENDELVWPSFFLFLCLTLLALVKLTSFSKVVRIIQSIFSKQIFQQLEREESNPFKFYSIALNFLFVLNVSFLVYKINTLNRLVLVESSAIVQFVFFLGVVLIVFSFKILANRSLANFTKERKIILDYSISSTLVNQSFGLFLFPLVILMEFSSFNPRIFITMALLVLSASILIKWYRGILMSLVIERVGLLQIFSYFCGLEILPVFVLVKYIIETF